MRENEFCSNILNWVRAKFQAERTSCRYCKSEFSSPGIIVCPICRHYQNRLRDLFAPSVSLVMVLVALAQLILASQKTVETWQLQNKVESTLAQVEKREAAINARLLAASDDLKRLENEISELTELSINIQLAFWDINSVRYLAAAIKNPNSNNAKFMNNAKLIYEDIRKRVRDRNYADYDDPEYCGLNPDLLRQNRKDELISQLKIQIRERSSFSTLFCLVILWGNKDLSKNEKLAFSYEVLQTVTNPFAIHYICMKVETEGEANLEKDFLLETDAYIKWLEKYK